MSSRRLLGTICLVLAAGRPLLGPKSWCAINLNVMTSGFFQGTNVVRGYAGEGEPWNA